MRKQVQEPLPPEEEARIEEIRAIEKIKEMAKLKAKMKRRFKKGLMRKVANVVKSEAEQKIID